MYAKFKIDGKKFVAVRVDWWQTHRQTCMKIVGRLDFPKDFKSRQTFYFGDFYVAQHFLYLLIKSKTCKCSLYLIFFRKTCTLHYFISLFQNQAVEKPRHERDLLRGSPLPTTPFLALQIWAWPRLPLGLLFVFKLPL